MNLKVFAVRDAKAEAFLQPFFSNATGSAVRAFADAVNGDKSSPIAKHPADYLLYEIGDYDDNSGLLMPSSPLKMLGCGADFVEQLRAPAGADMLKEVVANGGTR